MLSLTTWNLDDVEFSGGVTQEALHAARLETVGDTGYDLFVNLSDDAGTSHFRFASGEFLLGMRYGQTFYVGAEPDDSYDITELYLNGQRVANVKAHIDALAAGQKVK